MSLRPSQEVQEGVRPPLQLQSLHPQVRWLTHRGQRRYKLPDHTKLVILMGGGWVNKCKAISFFLRALPRSRTLMDIKLRYIQSFVLLSLCYLLDSFLHLETFLLKSSKLYERKSL